MEIEDNTTRQTYIQMLIETLEKKEQILIWLMNVTTQQEELISSDPFDQGLFEQTITIKDEHLGTLTGLDDGFEKIYNGVRTELLENKDKYVDEITALKSLIKAVTDLSVKLQALEQRNKAKLDFLFSQKRKGIKDSRISNKTATNYYKTMTKQHEVDSVFYDKKK